MGGLSLPHFIVSFFALALCAVGIYGVWCLVRWLIRS